ncbi:hypothetical protein TNIN_206801 [Trichonephila inaurata madagascariensis]|uniref:Uncharacterized protein n=1 Tax=Trichonephila inaurata madagascariensis TaxID=2747483 RepID=A0A8X6YDT5_9ARAC|nr:hypothetical protein TNIN_206801 [Trichonephila inaurata madagascariensis]
MDILVARVKTETGELVRPVQRLYNLELQEPEISLPKDLTDSVIALEGRKTNQYQALAGNSTLPDPDITVVPVATQNTPLT